MNTSGHGRNPTVLLSRTTINQNTRNALRSLVEHKMLAEFWTTFAWDLKSRWNRILPPSLQAQLARRSIPEVPFHRLRSVPWREAVRLGARGTPIESFLCSDRRPFSIVAMNLNFDARVAKRVSQIRPNIVYAYDGAALQTFREARKLAITTVHEQTISYWHWERKFFAEEAESNPEFASLLPSLADSGVHLDWKEEELRLADYIFVPSQHVRETLRGVVPDNKIRVISYGAPQARDQKRVSLDAKQPLKVLFAGSLTQRKGIGYLLDAMKMMGSHAELTLVGKRLAPHPRVDEACEHYRWYETLPHSKMLDVMQRADVLVLPSLSEGCALVVLEALSCGLPVVVTPNTGSLAFIRDGREGFIVPTRRSDAIAERLETLHRDRELLAEMSRQAQVTAAENSWENYRANWARAVRSLKWH